MVSETTKRNRKLNSQLRKKHGSQCETRGCTRTRNLEWAHTRKTGLSGSGRGRSNRVHDVLSHPKSYALKCKPHNPRPGWPKKWKLTNLKEVFLRILDKLTETLFSNSKFIVNLCLQRSCSQIISQKFLSWFINPPEGPLCVNSKLKTNLDNISELKNKLEESLLVIFISSGGTFSALVFRCLSPQKRGSEEFASAFK